VRPQIVIKFENFNCQDNSNYNSY